MDTPVIFTPEAWGWVSNAWMREAFGNFPRMVRQSRDFLMECVIHMSRIGQGSVIFGGDA